MKIEPACNYRSPKYPNSESQNKLSELIKSNIPKRWRGQEAHCADYRRCQPVLGWPVAFRRLHKKMRNRIHPKSYLRTKLIRQANPDRILLNMSRQFFIGGIGIGILGCVVIVPPVFLSEEEVRQTIEQEFSKEPYQVYTP